MKAQNYIQLILAVCAQSPKAAREAGWGKKLPEGLGMGFAVHYSFVSYVACILRIEVESSGNLIIHEATMAIDCGPQVNPDRIRSQMEGSCIMGLGIATTAKSASKTVAQNKAISRITRSQEFLWLQSLFPFIWSSRRTFQFLAVWANPGFHPSPPPFATQYLPRLENGFESCQLDHSYLSPTVSMN